MSFATYQLEKIKERVDPEYILGKLGVVDFQIRGDEIRCRCPIHNGEDYNFSWDLDRGIYTCFSHHCSEDRNMPRDVFLLVMIVKNLTFNEAVETVASWVGMGTNGFSFNKKDDDSFKIRKWITKRRKLEPSLRESLDESIMDAFDKFHHSYMINRGFSDEILNEFEVMYAKEGELAGRIVVPIRNENGELVGFSGRLPTDDKQTLKAKQKYKNFTDFRSGDVLYGLHKAIPYIQRDKVVVLVEGFFDVLRAWQNGIRNICATMGTTITTEQIKLVVKHTSRVYLAYDGDPPGRKAAWKIYGRLKNFCDVKFLWLNDGHDFGDLSPEEMWQLYDSPMNPLEFEEKVKHLI